MIRIFLRNKYKNENYINSNIYLYLNYKILFYKLEFINYIKLTKRKDIILNIGNKKIEVVINNIELNYKNKILNIEFIIKKPIMNLNMEYKVLNKKNKYIIYSTKRTLNILTTLKEIPFCIKLYTLKNKGKIRMNDIEKLEDIKIIKKSTNEVIAYIAK